MPVYLDSAAISDNTDLCESSLRDVGMRDLSNGSRPTLTIGLVNNMKDGALEATQRQFTSLLEAASKDIVIRLRPYRLSGVTRGTSATRDVTSFHLGIDAPGSEPLDGLIVTGREPSTTRLQDEPFWDIFVRLLEWAHDHTASTIWSCLAAHAAVLQMDGIPRIRSANKHCGLFECELLSDHAMIAGSPARFRIPHSRWNGLDEKHLAQHGYQILTKAEGVGVDAFVKHGRSLFVFFQGHPEYEANTLLLEYRRDVARYLRGEAAVYPSLPYAYFNDQTTASLREIGFEARLFPREELFDEVSAVLEEAEIHNSWRPTSVSIYRNWLHYLTAAKQPPSRRSTGTAVSSDVPEPMQVIAQTELSSRNSPPVVRSIQ